MKKTLICTIALITFVALSSFLHSSYAEMGNDFIYHGSTTAWFEETESAPIHIYYKEGHGVRKYYRGPAPENNYGVTSWSPIIKNSLYRSGSCRDYRRNYQYMVNKYYFNYDLPYFK